MTTQINREEWLTQAADKLWPLLVKAGAKKAKIHVSVGFPSKRALSTKKRVVGQCWAASASSDKAAQIFIHPVTHDAVAVLDTLSHEMIHAAFPDAGHKGIFVKIARELGREGKPTSDHAGPELKSELRAIASSLGKYPHPKFDPSMAAVATTETRLIKVLCEECGCILRMTRKWLATVGPPTCGCGGAMDVEV